MVTKKRKVPAAVREHQARRAKQNATLALRQSAGLDKSAKERLKPLLDEADGFCSEEEDSLLWPTLSFLPTSQFWQVPAGNLFSFGAGNTISFAPSTGVTLIDTAKIDALKVSEPRRAAVRVPDMVQCIVGWRAWTLRNGLLGALGVDVSWSPKEAIRAECKGGSQFHVAPHWGCQCGIWAFKDIDRLLAVMGQKYAGVCVVGSVDLWGKVIETENGYRAQYAYPKELWLLDNSLEELGLVYDVPIRTA